MGLTALDVGCQLRDPQSAPTWSLYTDRQRWSFLGILFLVSTSNYLDRNIVSVLLEPIKSEFQTSDAMLGLLSGFSFALFYAVAGIPVARWADRGNRRTIITLAIMIWSAMTVLCGLAQTMWQLILSRVGVGAGESGAIPPAHSLIADYFSPAERPFAIGIFMASSTVGSLLGLGVGGYVATFYGWRTAFILVGLPGVLLALVVRATLAEPRLRRASAMTQPPPQGSESFSSTITSLAGKPSYLFALGGCWLYFFAGYGALVFAPSFVIRVLGTSVAEAGAMYGLVTAVASFIGTLTGGWVANRLGRRDVRWLAWIPALACAVAGPIYMLAFSMNEKGAFYAIAFVGYLIFVGGLPPVYAAIHTVCGSSRRAMAIAIVLFSATLLGGGFGPLSTGALSDALSASYAAERLRYALIAMMSIPVAAGAAFYFFGVNMSKDLED